MKLKLREIIVDPAVSVRERNDEELTQEYMASFAKLPPVVVFKVKEGYLLADGFHRVAAAERLGHKDIAAEVRTGSRNDALEFAAVANMRHGKRLTGSDKRQAIQRIHVLHPNWPATKISEVLNVSEDAIGTVLRADQVRKSVPNAGPLPDEHLAAIASAPVAQRSALVEVAKDKGWTARETQAAVQNIKDETLPSDFKKAILRGRAEPITTKEKEPAVLAETIARKIAEAKEADTEIALWGMLEHVSKLRIRWPAPTLIKGLDRKRLDHLNRELPQAVRYLQDVLHEVEKTLRGPRG